MANKIYDVLVSREYTTATGEKKYYLDKVGVAFLPKNDEADGLDLELNTMPLPTTWKAKDGSLRTSVRMMIRVRRQRTQRGAQQDGEPDPGKDDNIPF